MHCLRGFEPKCRVSGDSKGGTSMGRWTEALAEAMRGEGSWETLKAALIASNPMPESTCGDGPSTPALVPGLEPPDTRHLGPNAYGSKKQVSGKAPDTCPTLTPPLGAPPPDSAFVAQVRSARVEHPDLSPRQVADLLRVDPFRILEAWSLAEPEAIPAADETAAGDTPAVEARDRTLPLPTVEVVADEDGLRRLFAATANTPLLGFDTETTGLDPHRDRLRLVQVATREAVFVVDAAKVDVRLLIPWLADLAKQGGRLIGHNLSFDLGFLRVALGPEAVFPEVADTMILSQLLTCAREPWTLHEHGRHTLAAVTGRYLGVA